MKRFLYSFVFIPLSAIFAAVAVSNIDAWKDYRDKAYELENKKEYISAVEQFVKAASQADETKNYKVKAWMLNNASYMLIKAHQYKLDTDLVKAKAYLEEASGIPEAETSCKTKIKNNLEYVNFWIKKTKK